jgi:hypothetical protein
MARRSNIGIAKQLTQKLNKSIAHVVQDAAVEITNGLAQAGPAWSGSFSSAWDVVPAGRKGSGVRNEGSVYRYTRRNFPLKRFEQSLSNGRGRFFITNGASYALVALDQVESIFQRYGSENGYPIKPIIKEGFRPQSMNGQDDHLRWQVGESYSSKEPNAGITAEKDWFITYGQGGQLQRNLAKGVSIGISASIA